MKIEDLEILEKLLELSKNGKSKQERIRAHAIILSNERRKSFEIAKIFNVTQRTIFRWFKDFKKLGFKILHYENLVIEVVDSWIWLSGETRAIKEVLKELKFKWASKKKMWYYGEMKGKNLKQKSMDEIKAKYRCTTVATKASKRIA